MSDKVLQFLKHSSGYLSGEEISRNLNLSRTAIWKYIQELRNDGYEIVAVPHLGYKLISAPDKLLPQEIQFQLNTKVFGRTIVHFDTIHSTMDEAFRLGMEGKPEGTIVIAESQSKGRGRLGRAWSSPKGKGIYASLIVRPKFSPTEMSRLTLMSAVALMEAIEKVSDVKVQIKWPNDLLIKGKKLAGILTESRAEVEQIKFVVIGIGINVNNTQAQLIENATSLRMETHTTISRIELTQEILRAFERWYNILMRQGFDFVLKAWKERSQTLNKWIRISDQTGIVEGEAVDLDKDGGLLIRQESGVVVKKMAGDVILLK